MKRTFHYKVSEDVWKIDVVLKAEIKDLFASEQDYKFNALQDDLFEFLFDRFHVINIEEVK